MGIIGITGITGIVCKSGVYDGLFLSPISPRSGSYELDVSYGVTITTAANRPGKQ